MAFEADAGLAEDEADLALIREAAIAAGKVALSFAGVDALRQWTKDDASPVTEADIAVDRVLRETLRGARPDYGWLSEETADDRARLARRRTFVVDPIDGTKAFIRGEDRWMVCVAVVEDARPVAGCLVRPPTGDVFVARRGGGAFHGDRPLSIPPCPRPEGARIAGPRRLLTQPPAVAAGIEPAPYVPSLALRLAMVAAGTLDGTVARGGAKDWDLAAADLIVSEAGGEVVTEAGTPLAFNAHGVAQPLVIACRRGLERHLAPLAAAWTAGEAARA